MVQIIFYFKITINVFLHIPLNHKSDLLDFFENYSSNQT